MNETAHAQSGKWLMFKNYMHNELGITKEDIRDWIKEAAKEAPKSQPDAPEADPSMNIPPVDSTGLPF